MILWGLLFMGFSVGYLYILDDYAQHIIFRFLLFILHEVPAGRLDLPHLGYATISYYSRQIKIHIFDDYGMSTRHIWTG